MNESESITKSVAEPLPYQGNSIYGGHLEDMKVVMEDILSQIDEVRKSMIELRGKDPVDHCLARIKSEESMREKCRNRRLPETPHAALRLIHDAIGIRIVCGFISDIYAIRDRIAEFRNTRIVYEKDYIRHAKANGYRSDHMILLADGKYYVEVQLRTISMDTWAALEHQLRYKKNATANDTLIASELKRCADELASTDVSMQTIRDMIYGEGDLWT